MNTVSPRDNKNAKTAFIVLASLICVYMIVTVGYR